MSQTPVSQAYASNQSTLKNLQNKEEQYWNFNITSLGKNIFCFVMLEKYLFDRLVKK